MSFFLLAVIIAGIFAFLATQNTTGVPLQLGPYSWSSLPLYIIALGSLIVGLVIAWMLSVIDWAATVFTLHGKDRAIQKAETTVDELSRKVKTLEEENTRLKERYAEERTILSEEHDEEDDHRPTFFHRMRHNLSH